MGPADRPRHDESRAGATVHVPEHVVCREFPGQTVALNLRTGRYHGLNPTAAEMLEALRATGSVGAAAERLAGRWNVAGDVLVGDLLALCDALESRGLLETGDAG